MKKIIILALLILTLGSCKDPSKIKCTYTGVVLQKTTVTLTTGSRNRVESEEVRYLIMKEKKTGLIYRVNVIVPLYYRAKKGEVLTFSISNMDMYLLGNTVDYNKNLYGK